MLDQSSRLSLLSFPASISSAGSVSAPQHGFRPLYLDNAATTPMVSDLGRCGKVTWPYPIYLQDPQVLDAMLPYLSAYYGNPHSRTHAYGWESEEAVETARKVCIILLGEF